VPPIAVTMGDPAGIGGEVALKALESLPKDTLHHYCVLGDFDYLSQIAKLFKIRLPLTSISDVSEARFLKGRLGVLDLGGAENVRMGTVSAASGKAALRYITEGAHLALKKKVSALVTAPISKEAIHKAGSLFPGHTELLAHLSPTKSFAMMMVGGPFKIVLQSIHLSLRESVEKVKPALVWDKLKLTHKTLRNWFGIRHPRIAVAGVNPHAGENGAFGTEEIRVLKPVVQKARKRGWEVSGPHPPDTLFYWAGQGKYDAVLCMYHDQGLIPLKLTAFDTGVNLTLGLPFVRTSPDHGTAFDIAGKGIASPHSMSAAIRLADGLVKKKWG
jgi:4-phospho-D-threonate 3-dehydrogenase / 4-phospho-D-erythronate 3-dehydrogenase